MQSMVRGMPCEDLVRELEMHSPTLRRLNDGFGRAYNDVNILTIYEMEPTPTLRKGEFDIWEKTGLSVMMVENHSAILYWPMETRIGLNQDHSRIAKVDRGQNGCYDDICHFLQQSLLSTDKAIMPIVNTRPLHSPASSSSAHKANIMRTVSTRPLHSSALPSSSKDGSVLSRELCEAIKNGDSETARDLIQLVDKGSFAQLSGNSLGLAIRYCPEVVSTLLDAGADISARVDETGDQAIHHAGRFAKKPETVKVLLDAGADVNTRQDDGMVPLHSAVRDNNNPMIIQFLIDAGATVNASDKSGLTPLHLAARQNDSKILQALIDAGALVNASDNLCGFTPLHFASSNKNPEICCELLNAGAHVDQKNEKGCTALHLAIYYGNKAVVSRLLEFGADLRAKSKDGVRPEDLEFSADVPSITRNQIRELMIKAVKTAGGRPGMLPSSK